jgi:hypothetical protein
VHLSFRVERRLADANALPVDRFEPGQPLLGRSLVVVVLLAQGCHLAIPLGAVLWTDGHDTSMPLSSPARPPRLVASGRAKMDGDHSARSSSGDTLTATPLYHVGIHVTDVEEAMAHFGAALGLTFNEPRVVPLTELEAYGQPAPARDLTVVYSIEGPPYLELIEAQDTGVWGHHHGEGLHHVGSYHDDLAARVAELMAAGTPPECTVYRAGELLAAYVGPEHTHNTRLELVRRPV